MKPRIAAAGGGEVAIGVGRPGPGVRVRTLVLGLATATFGLLSAMLLASGAVMPALVIPAELVSRGTVEPVAGHSWLEVVGAGSGAAAAWLLVRRMRGAARRRASAPRPEDLATQTALVAAWVNKGASLLDRPALADDVVVAPMHAPGASPSPPVPHQEAADPSVAADFVAWGRQAARSGDQRIAQRLLSQAVRLDPTSEEGWLWLAGTCEQRADAIACLQRALAINPKNVWARRGLDELRAEDRP